MKNLIHNIFGKALVVLMVLVFLLSRLPRNTQYEIMFTHQTNYLAKHDICLVHPRCGEPDHFNIRREKELCDI